MPGMRVLRRLFVLFAAASMALAPVLAFAHGPANPAPGPSSLFTAWEFDPLFLIPFGFTAWLYYAGVRRVAATHPASPFPRRRVVYFALGMGAMAIALMSPLATYDGDLFAVHMWQHVVITMVAAPLLLLGAPITLALRAASPGVRRGVLLPILHSRPLKVLSFPVLAWVLFAVTMWWSHFTPLFNAALENEWLHRMEHGWYLGAALLFWWPVLNADPGPWRMNHPTRLLYLFMQMPQNAFLANAIYSAGTVRYRHYAELARTWGPSPLTDQELAGITMWVGGDLLFLVAMGFIAYGWVQHEERAARRIDRQLAREKAARTAAAATAPSEG
ncbi:MAG: cytochrome c oxidase assembly protein [Dehalococcoidia bacterium]